MKSFIHAKIVNNDSLSFADYMAMALYEQNRGYYARGELQVGREGDFYTSVSVGPVFGQLLAHYFLEQWHMLGEPSNWRITECGAHDGKLALDILDALGALNVTAYTAVEYTIPDPLENLRAAQTITLAEHTTKLTQIADSSQLKPKPGVIFGNEVLDALPCQLIEMTDDGWQERRVTCEGETFTWQLSPITDSKLLVATGELSNAFPVGYRTEVRCDYEKFLKPLHDSLSHGRMLWIDYGFERTDYYHPDRREGTLRTFSHHQAGSSVLSHPGEVDISAHVDFTAVAEACRDLGGHPHSLISQGNWLTHRAKDWLLAQEGNPDPKTMRQFQTLTHPGLLGRTFQVLEVDFG